jgi:hypothetical protein
LKSQYLSESGWNLGLWGGPELTHFSVKDAGTVGLKVGSNQSQLAPPARALIGTSISAYDVVTNG